MARLLRRRPRRREARERIETQLGRLQLEYRHSMGQVREGFRSGLGRLQEDILEGVKQVIQGSGIAHGRLIDCSEVANEPGRSRQQEHDDCALASQINQLSAEKEKLEALSNRLKKENKEYLAKIVSLQAYRDELLPNAAGARYKSVLSNIDSWVNQRVGEIINGPGAEEEFVRWAKSQQSLIRPFKDVVGQDKDFAHMCAWPQAEIITISAFITRFLNGNLFKAPLYGNTSSAVQFINSVEASMAEAKPEIEPSNIRRWVADSYRGMFGTAANQQDREVALWRMAENLADMIPFLNPAEKHEEFQQTLMEEIIAPAFSLQEDMLSSTRVYLFQFRSARAINKTVRSCRTVQEVVRVLGGLELINAADGHRKLRFEELNPQPTPKQFVAGLEIIATLSPALVYKEVPPGRGGRVDEELMTPVVAARQHMLVSWSPPGSQRISWEQSGSWLLSILQDAE